MKLSKNIKIRKETPHIKGRRKELFREIAYSEGPSATKRAQAIITNPTHIAVAIGYDEKEKDVPLILTMGQGAIAEKIITIAIEEKIQIMRNVPLAHELFNKGKIGDYIPIDTYKAVAEILKWIESLERAEKEVIPELFK